LLTIFRDIFVLLKISILTIFMFLAIKRYYVKQRGHSMTTFLLTYKIFCLVGILIFDFTTRYIFMFYILILSSNFVTYMAFLHVMRTVELPQRLDLRKRTKWFYYLMNSLYLLMIPLAFVPGFAPICSNYKPYPATLFYCNILFLFNSAFFFYMHYNKFFLEKFDEDIETPFASDIAYDDKIRHVFTQQMNSYHNYTVILSIVQVIVIVLGRIYIYEGGYLTCTGGGYEWLYSSIGGELFILGMMITMMMQSVMVEKFLYRIPLNNGYFEEEKIDD
jgi:hypothetical protein